MTPLTGAQRKYLRGLAHKLNPAAFVGQKGLTPSLTDEINMALDAAELIKIKFNDHKEKEVKTALIEEITAITQSHLAGMVGHVAILFRRQADPEKQKIKLP
ncbi:MAG: YhbY family RNA-binding protein [Proteobacteria bacterium]|nr:YhbY family RNA-binding protein [Desulfobacula sp.]MBU3951698.1 YhbY family RNA-binding protein [Pseudomonadota bacterium]MBU4132372.1 YhbY family RNA-binding protein [Pseudomonadota bacterium]